MRLRDSIIESAKEDVGEEEIAEWMVNASYGGAKYCDLDEEKFMQAVIDEASERC